MFFLLVTPRLPMRPTKKSEMDGLHQEIKFIASANTQIKFYNQQLPRDIFRRLGDFLNVLDIEVEESYSSGNEKSAARKEIYFDYHWSLANMARALSIRSHDGNDIDGPGSDVLILRSNRQDENQGLQCLSRYEYRRALTREDADDLIKHGISVAKLNEWFPLQNIPEPDDRLFYANGEVNIKRQWHVARIDDEKYFVYMDQFNFSVYEFGTVSEFYTELDVERQFDVVPSIDCDMNFHPRMVQFANVLKTAFDIKPDATPKYERFRKFYNTNGMEYFYFIGFDVTDYSNRTSWVQKYLSQRFHQILGERVARGGFAGDREPIRIPIGDGAIIAVADISWRVIAKILKEVKNAVTKHNRDVARRQASSGGVDSDKSESLEIQYHTGIHHGGVYRFTDLNNMMNLAGEGISTLSRVLHEAGEGEVLISKAAIDEIKDSTPASSLPLEDLGPRTVKHGKALHLFRYNMT